MNHLLLEAVASGKPMAIGDAGLTAILGYAVVFLGLVALMVVTYIMAAFFKKKKAKALEAAPETPLQEAPAAVPVAAKTAPGSAGGIKLYNVSDKDAALIMAIVADKLQKPLNELRFQSIKEVTKK